jgi:hypothetical protein
MKICKYFLLIILTVISLESKPVSSNSAKQAAYNYLSEVTKYQKDQQFFLEKNSLYLYDSKLINSTDTLYYIFQSKTGGWIIMSADDKLEPVIGYSYNSDFDKNNLPPSFKSWISVQENSFAHIINDNINFKSNDKYQQMISGKSIEFFQASKPNIAPLVKTRWNQGYPYNLLCPLDKEKNQHAITGCVATAMAQLINYFNFPIIGKGSNKYTHPDFGEIETDFSKSVYKYNLMKNTQSEYKDDESKMAVARLMSDCGVAANMHYGLGGSGAASGNAMKGLISNFGYDAKMFNCAPKTTDEEWYNLLYDNLNYGIPMYYAGYSGKLGSGHAFVCDGFENGKFHFNWGWGGSADGYFFTGYQSVNHEFGNGMHIIAYLVPSDLSLGSGDLTPDKFEQNNTPETATIINPTFENGKFQFNHKLNLHDSTDLDYFVFDLSNSENDFVFELNYSDSFYSNEEVQNAGTIKIIVEYSGKTDTLYKPKVLLVEGGGIVKLKIEPLFKFKYGTYLTTFSVFKYIDPFIKIEKLENDFYYSHLTVPVKWVSNMNPPFDIELVHDLKPTKFFGIQKNIDGFEFNWKLDLSLPNDSNYKFKITNSFNPKIVSYTNLFKVQQMQYLYIDDPNWSTDVNIGTNHVIIWYTNFRENVSIELLRYGHFYQYIATNVVNKENFNWIVSDSIQAGEGYQVKISKFDDDRVFTLSEEFFIQPSTSVDDLSNSNLLIISTNEKSNLSVKIENENPDKLILFDISGKIISEQINPDMKINNVWQIPQLVNGVYFIQEIKSGKQKTHKLVL